MSHLNKYGYQNHLLYIIKEYNTSIHVFDAIKTVDYSYVYMGAISNKLHLFCRIQHRFIYNRIATLCVFYITK